MFNAIINYAINRKTVNYDLRENFFSLTRKYIFHYKFQFFFAIISLVFLHKFQVYTTTKIVDISNKNFFVNSNLILKLILLSLGILLFRTLSRCLFFFPARLQQTDLRNSFLDLLVKSEPLLWRMNSTGKLFEVIITDFEELRVFFGFMFLQVFNLLISIIIIVPAMVSIHPGLIQSLIPLGVCFAIFSFSLSWTSNISEKAKTEHDILQQMVIEFYDAKRTLNVFSKEDSALGEFNRQSHSELNYFLKSNIIRSFTRPLLMLGSGLSLVYAAKIVKENNLPLSYLVVYSTFIFLLFEPLGYLSWMGVIFTDSRISWKRIKSLVNAVCINSPQVNKIGIDIKQHDLTFRLPGLENLSLELKNSYLIFGPTSGGKTYLLENLHRTLLSLNISSVLVPQDPFLFDHTLKDNLFLGIDFDNTLKNRALDLLKIFELDNLCSSDEDIFNIHVGEKGKKLSGGQVKRLHMVRSLLFYYDFIIWDDPFSAIDVLTEKRIMMKLFDLKSEYLKNKTFFLTSHRMSTFKYFNNLIYLTKDGMTYGIQDGSLMQSHINDFFHRKADT